MNQVNLLSDTVYRDQAARKLDHKYQAWNGIPVARAQLYGLREIARNQPTEVPRYAKHQEKRANAKGARHRCEADFWQLVQHLYERRTGTWSLVGEGRGHLPIELRDENVPEKRKGMSPEERRLRNRLKAYQREWLHEWQREHVPAFFQRFCAHALYLVSRAEESRREERR